MAPSASIESPVPTETPLLLPLADVEGVAVTPRTLAEVEGPEPVATTSKASPRDEILNVFPHQPTHNTNQKQTTVTIKKGAESVFA